jgi:hypothetical protein
MWIFIGKSAGLLSLIQGSDPSHIPRGSKEMSKNVGLICPSLRVVRLLLKFVVAILSDRPASRLKIAAMFFEVALDFRMGLAEVDRHLEWVTAGCCLKSTGR